MTRLIMWPVGFPILFHRQSQKYADIDPFPKKWTGNELLEKLEHQNKELEKTKIQYKELQVALKKSEAENEVLDKENKVLVKKNKVLDKENKVLNKENKERELMLSEMKEETNRLSIKQQTLIKQWHCEIQTLEAQKKELQIESKDLIDEKNQKINDLKQANDILTEQLKEKRNTVREMGLWWMIRVLYPSHFIIDCFFVFCFALPVVATA